MYISNFMAFNYRSLKHISIQFKQGKNVIVGKNNSGKSNILRALEILIGEKWPTYQHISENDYYTYEEINTETGEITEIISDNIYFHLKLEGNDIDEELINQIKKKTAFSKVKNIDCLFPKNEDGQREPNFTLFQSLDVIEDLQEIDNTNNRPSWKNSTELLEFLNNNQSLYLFFCKSRLDEEKAGFGLICITKEKEYWISHFLSKKLRDSLITATYVSSLRSQKEDLKVVYYSWFGKLITKLWENNKLKIADENGKSYDEKIKEQTGIIKELVDALFRENITKIRDILSGAIANSEISFKLLNDTKNELYKNVQIFINDGIDRPIFEKGTGIQSALIIALFSLYCDNFHNKSSLLITEEPELFLHPHARRVLSKELDNYLSSSINKERQLIVSTHSTEFIKNIEPQNIIRIYKNQTLNCSESYQIKNNISDLLTTEFNRFIWSNNSEIFFADKVILVEGGEVFLIPSIIDKLNIDNNNNNDNILSLDAQNISIARVNGKGNFLTYIKMLKEFHIDYLILGDLDCFKDEIHKISDYLNISNIRNDLDRIKLAINQIETDYSKIKERIKYINNNRDAQKLKEVFEKFLAGNIQNNDNELIEIINYMQSRYKGKNIIDIILETIQEKRFREILKILKDNKIFIWSKGDLESYYTNKSKSIEGSKDIKALKLSYYIKENNSNIDEYFNHIDEFKELKDFIQFTNNE